MTAAAAVTQSGEKPRGADPAADWWSFFSNGQCSKLGGMSKDLGGNYWSFFGCYDGGLIEKQHVAGFREHLMKLKDVIWEMEAEEFCPIEEPAIAPDGEPVEVDRDKVGYLTKKTLYMSVAALVLLCSIAIERDESVCLVGD